MINAGSKKILNAILDYKNKKQYDEFSYEIEEIEGKSENTRRFREIINVPQSIWFSWVYRPREIHYTQFWTQNDNNGFSLYYKTLPKQEAKQFDPHNIMLPSLEESFIILPIAQQTEQCFVLFVSRIDFGGSIHSLIRDKLKIRRTGILLGLREYVHEMKVHPEVKFQLASSNRSSIYTEGKKLSLEKRYPGCYKYRKGGIVCHDFMNHSKVADCEARTELERLADFWCTGPYYLSNAAIIQEPLERVKNIIAFVVSGLYTGLLQKKALEPTLGETYQATWPDSASITMECINNQQTTICFYVKQCENITGLL